MIIIVLMAVFAIVYYYFLSPKAVTRSGIYAYNTDDEAAFQQIMAWVAANDSFEYGWWSNDVALYMPGGARGSAGMYGLHADMPDGSISKTQRVMVAMSELHYNKAAGTDCKVTDKDAYAFATSVYYPFKANLIK